MTTYDVTAEVCPKCKGILTIAQEPHRAGSRPDSDFYYLCANDKDHVAPDWRPTKK